MLFCGYISIRILIRHSLTTMSGYEAALRRNIEVMNSLEGFDIVMVCCSSDKQAHYWQHRLEKGRGAVLPQSAMVLAVEEDWPGGAGNGKDDSALGMRCE